MFFKCVYVVVVIVNNFEGDRGSFRGHVRRPQLADGASLVVMSVSGESSKLRANT